MQNFDIVGALAFFTIGAVLVFGIFSLTRAKKAQDHHEDAAVAQRQREDDGAPPRETGQGAQRDSRTGERIVPQDSGRTWSHERGANPPTAPVNPPD